eukprot:SAG31_NODE_604_length_13629_cov_11.035994_8_plen_73_part_00
MSIMALPVPVQPVVMYTAVWRKMPYHTLEEKQRQLQQNLLNYAYNSEYRVPVMETGIKRNLSRFIIGLLFIF